MRNFALICAGLLALGACTAAQQAAVTTAVNTAVADGQLFCAKATSAGPLVVAATSALGAPVIVTGMASAAVAAVCAGIDAIPVSPPANPGSAPVVAVPGVA